MTKNKNNLIYTFLLLHLINIISTKNVDKNFKPKNDTNSAGAEFVSFLFQRVKTYLFCNSWSLWIRIVGDV